MTRHIPADLVKAQAKESGWVIEKQTEHSVTFFRPGPMINRSDRNRVTVVFRPTGPISQAWFGPDDRATLMGRNGRPPNLATVLAHLINQDFSRR